jgi:hypothetical protein
LNSTPHPIRSPALEALLEREKRFGLQQLKVLGYPLWGLERFAYFERLTAGNSTTAPGKADPTRAARVRTSLTDLVSPARFQGRDIWVLSSTQYRREESPGVSRCMFAPHLEQQFGSRLLFLERNVAAIPCTHDPSVLFIDALLEAATGVAAQLAPALARFVGADAREGFEPISAQRLAKNALIGQLFEALALSLIKLLRPKAVFVLCGYTRFVPFQRVLKRAGIPIIELQHGVIHMGHAGYVLADEAPADYLPDHMLVFGERFGKVLERCSDYWRGRWTVGGHPLLSERAKHVVPEASRRGPVVVFSQAIAPVSSLLQEFLPAFRRALPSDVEIILKPHPRETNPEQFYAAALAAGVRLAEPRSDSYQLLATCRASVTVFSTLALEALAFPCTSFVIRSEHWPEVIRQFVADGTLLAADTPEQLALLVQEPTTVHDRQAVARELFGIGEPAPDLLGLLARLRPGVF